MDNEFNNWVNQWEKAQEEGLFKDLGKDKQVDINLEKNSKESFFGSLDINNNSEPSQDDIDNWRGISNYTEAEILNESNDKKNQLKKTAEKLANNANPINPDTVNKDSNRISKGFVFNDLIEKLKTLKEKMYKLENEVLTKEAMGKNYKKAEKELEKVKSLIDEISDSINPGRFEPGTKS